MATASADRALIDAALEALEQATGGRLKAAIRTIGSSAGAGRRSDAEIELKHGRRTHRFVCEIKRSFGQRSLSAVAAQIESMARSQPHPVVLVTEYASPATIDRLIDQGIPFLDTAGNSWLLHDDLCIVIRGRTVKHKRTSAKYRSARTTWSRAALPVLHRLLNEPEALSMAYRDLAAISTVSVGTVHNTFDELKQRGFLKTIDHRTRLIERDVLFEQWVASYPQYLRGRLARRRLVIPGAERLGDLAREHRQALGDRDWVISGESAAWLMDGYLRPESLTLYGNGDLDALCKLLGARPAADGAIEVLQAFWTGHTSPGGDWGLADAMLVYADLVYSGDPRAREAAIRIRDEQIHFAAPAG